MQLYENITGNALPNHNNASKFMIDFPAEIQIFSQIDQERIIDIFEFEKKRYFFSIHYPSDADALRIELQSVFTVKQVYSRNQSDLDEFTFTINPLIMQFSTKWNWYDVESFQRSAIPYQPQEMIVLVDYTTMSLLEIDLTKLNLITMQIFSSPCNYSAAFKRIKEFINITDIEELDTHFFKGIVYLISQGILLIN